MKKKKNFKKILLISLLCALFFAAGVFVGHYILFYKSTKEFWKNQGSMGMVFFMAVTSQYAQLQYQNAGYDDAKAALLEFIALCDAIKGEEDRFFGEKVYYVDTGLAYSRLALLEERFGHREEMQKYFKDAQKRFQAGGWTNISEARIREILLRLDEKAKRPIKDVK
jgi:hypothetical protein